MNGKLSDQPIEEVTTAILLRLLSITHFWASVLAGNKEVWPRQKIKFGYEEGNFVNIHELTWGPLLKKQCTVDHFALYTSPNGHWFNKEKLVHKRTLVLNDSLIFPVGGISVKVLPNIPKRRS